MPPAQQQQLLLRQTASSRAPRQPARHGAEDVALADAMEAPMVTCDGPLAEAPGHRARIEVID